MTLAADAPPRRWGVFHLMLALPWVAVVIGAWVPLRDNSFLWHVRAGTLQLDAARILTNDPFSFTMSGEPWRTQSWLAEIGYGWLEGVAAGLGFVPPMNLVLDCLIMGGIGLIAFARSRSVLGTAIVLVLTTVLLLSFLVPRPVIFSFLLFVAVTLAWNRPSVRWTLPFLFWLWASIHGSFALGLVYLGLMLLADREWRWLPVALMSGLVTLGTPHGVAIVEVLLSFGASRDVLPLLTEWRRPELLSAVFLPFVAGLVILAIGVARRRIPLRYLVVIAPFATLAFTATRAVPPSWLALVPLVALGLAGLPGLRSHGLSAVSAGLALLLILVIPFLVRGDGGIDEERFPEKATAHLEGLRTFHDDRTGGYLIWAEGPEFEVYIDDRAELYGDRMREFVEVRDGEIPWEPVFERDHIAQVLLKRETAVVTSLLEAGWNVELEDGEFVLLRP